MLRWKVTILYSLGFYSGCMFSLFRRHGTFHGMTLVYGLLLGIVVHLGERLLKARQRERALTIRRFKRRVRLGDSKRT